MGQALLSFISTSQPLWLIFTSISAHAKVFSSFIGRLLGNDNLAGSEDFFCYFLGELGVLLFSGIFQLTHLEQQGKILTPVSG